MRRGSGRRLNERGLGASVDLETVLIVSRLCVYNFISKFRALLDNHFNAQAHP